MVGIPVTDRTERPRSVKWAAQYLDCSTKTVKRMFSRGLEHFTLGDTTRPYTTKEAIHRFKRYRGEPMKPDAQELARQQQIAEALKAIGV